MFAGSVEHWAISMTWRTDRIATSRITRGGKTHVCCHGLVVLKTDRRGQPMLATWAAAAHNSYANSSRPDYAGPLSGAPSAARCGLWINRYPDERDLGEAESVQVAHGLHEGEAAEECQPFDACRRRVCDHGIGNRHLVAVKS